MKILRLSKIFSAPLIVFAFLFNTYPGISEIKASTKTVPANEKDLDFYRKMGIAYICSSSEKGNDKNFEKSLVIAANLFSTVLQQKHGATIKEGKKKEQKLDPKTLQNSVLFQLVGGSLTFCPDNVPDKIEEEFKLQVKKLQELDKK